MFKRLFVLILPCLALGFTRPAIADEGMWTFDNFPKSKVKIAYGFEPSDDWLGQVMRASARIGAGCSASFVSSEGLVVTNHHCVHDCLEAISTAKRDLASGGYYAPNSSDELRCPETEVHQLLEIKDITAAVNFATKGLKGSEYHRALKAEQAKLEKECQIDATTRCDFVSLYRGGQYRLHKYRRFDDVRMVFAPEKAAAFFGGDPYNFTFPRFDLDVSFLRVYENGKPAATPEHFKWSKTLPPEGTLTFVSGNPGSTERLLTRSQLEYQRDIALPEYLISLAEWRGLVTEFGRHGAEEKRISQDFLFGVENSYKARRGRWQALSFGNIVEEHAAAERKLLQDLKHHQQLSQQTSAAWFAIDGAVERQKQLRTAYRFIEGNGALPGDLARIARALVRGTAEQIVPNEQRLEEYRESGLPSLKQRLFSQAPIYDRFQTLLLTHGLTKLREELGVNHAFVKKVLAERSPEELANILVKGTKVGDVNVRKQLWQGGSEAVKAAAKTDPLLALVLLTDADAREVRKTWESEVDSVVLQNAEILAKARFAAYGTQGYPDATFSARLSFGAIAGYVDNGSNVAPFTTVAGLFERHTGRDPFSVAPRWLAAKDKLDLKVPLNFVTTNDIIGGNSGSPVINSHSEIVGLIFDGNIQSLGGDYGFDAATNRAVSVSAVAITQALKLVYGADRLVRELGY
jgi:hypothetical protein